MNNNEQSSIADKLFSYFVCAVFIMLLVGVIATFIHHPWRTIASTVTISLIWWAGNAIISRSKDVLGDMSVIAGLAIIVSILTSIILALWIGCREVTTQWWPITSIASVTIVILLWRAFKALRTFASDLLYGLSGGD